MTIPFVTAGLPDRAAGVCHGFFGRRGGVSQGDFGSLNCSPFSGDSPPMIEQNRSLVVKALGAKTLVSNKQVHGNTVRLITSGADFEEIIEADGLVTAEPNIALGALGADCAPVLFFDAKAGVIAAAHAGWQGAMLGITDTVIHAMCEVGATISSIIAMIGPAIQKESYEVGEEFRQKIVDQSPVEAVNCFHVHPQTGNVHFDLPGYIHLRLRAAGVLAVEQIAEDTYQQEDRYFSFRRSCHRKEKDYGRQIGAICLTRSA